MAESGEAGESRGLVAARLTALDLVRSARSNRSKFVLAESCTGGLASALMAEIPGISKFFCGSAVTYREATKSQWLDVSPKTIERCTAVSKTTTLEMAIGVLNRTPEASFAAAIAGHLGPDAPPKLDGVVFVAIANRIDGKSVIDRWLKTRLHSVDRVSRQVEAATLLLGLLGQVVSAGD